MEKDGKTFEDSQNISTNLFCEKVRCGAVAAEILIAYMTDKEFRKNVDAVWKRVPNSFVFGAKLSADLDEFIGNEVLRFTEWYELGIDEEPEVSDDPV